MAELIVYSSEKNSRCEELKTVLREQGIPVGEICITSPVAVAELRKHGCYALEPLVLQVVHNWMRWVVFKNDDLFWDGRLVKDAVLDHGLRSRMSLS